MPKVRLIDANALIKDIVESIHLADKWEIESHEKKDEYWLKHAIATRQSLMAMLSRVKESPTIEAEPVRHGRWIEHGGGVVATCSNCNATFCKDVLQSLAPYAEHLTRHCPNCGARMDLRTPTEVALDMADCCACDCD